MVHSLGCRNDKLVSRSDFHFVSASVNGTHASDTREWGLSVTPCSQLVSHPPPTHRTSRRGWLTSYEQAVTAEPPPSVLLAPLFFQWLWKSEAKLEIGLKFLYSSRDQVSDFLCRACGANNKGLRFKEITSWTIFVRVGGTEETESDRGSDQTHKTYRKTSTLPTLLNWMKQTQKLLIYSHWYHPCLGIHQMMHWVG